MIGTCDCCDRKNVPVSHIDTVFGIEAFACYLCQHEDNPDPYGELVEDKQMSNTEQVIEAAILALVAEFIGSITGLRPPVERELFPPQMKPALNRLCDGLMQLVVERSDCSRATDIELRRKLDRMGR